MQTVLDIFSRALELASQGGPVLWILFGLSLLALAIALLKVYQLARSGVWSLGWLPETLALVRRGNPAAARARARGARGPLARGRGTSLVRLGRRLEKSVRGEAFGRSGNHSRIAEMVSGHKGQSLLASVLGRG